MNDQQHQQSARDKALAKARAEREARLDRFAKMAFEFTQQYAATGSWELQLLAGQASALASGWKDTNGNKLRGDEAAAEARVNKAWENMKGAQ